MPLFSPSLHGIAGMPTVTNPDGADDRLVFSSTLNGRAVRAQLARHAQEECYIFGLSGITTDSPLTANFTVSLVTPRIEVRWPFSWICTGIRTSVSGRPAAGTGAAINILREGTSVFDNTTNVATFNASIATGAGNLYSSLISPHASQVSWTKGDRLQMYITAGANGSGNAANNFHALKIMLFGYRR